MFQSKKKEILLLTAFKSISIIHLSINLSADIETIMVFADITI